MLKPFSNPMARDYRIDFFRGLALISIFVNHIPGNFYSNFTHRNFGLSDSAEVFVLLAGMSAALAYFPRFLSGQAPSSIGTIAKRIGTLYVAQLSSVAIGFALYAAAAVWLNNPELMVPDERHWMMDEPLKAMAGIGALTYQTGNFNILPMYIGLLLMLPAIMALARIRLSLALAASLALWLLANIFRLTVPSYPAQGGWYFNPITWQLIFTIGFVMGVKLRRGDRITGSSWLYLLALAYLAVSAVLVMGAHWDKFPPLPEWVWVSGFDKSWVGVFRLLHLLALVYVIVFSPIPKFLTRWLDADNWVVRLGRNTLPVFWLSIVLAVSGHILRENVFGLPNDPTFDAAGILVDTALIGIGMTLLLALAFFLDWSKPGARTRLATNPSPSRGAMSPAE